MNVFDKLAKRSDIIINDVDYMHRWRLIRTKRFGARLHHIITTDPDPDLHDHPFDFVSIILSGGYHEELRRFISPGMYGPLERLSHPPLSIVRRDARDMHRVILDPGRTAWTICFRGPQYRPWGFLVEGVWTHFKQYVSRHDSYVTDSKLEWSSPDPL